MKNSFLYMYGQGEVHNRLPIYSVTSPYDCEHEEKDDADECEQYLKENDVKCLWHITPVVNVQSIQENGICSYQLLNSLGIPIPCPGGDDISRETDRRNGLSNYIHLLFADHHPMFWKYDQKDIAVLEIDPCVVRWKNTLFSDMNSIDRMHSHGPTFSDLQQINISSTKGYFRRGTRQFKEMQAEVMVEEWIHPDYIREIHIL